jgi:hypothetical protein
VIRHQGVPRCIRSDRDPRFTSQIWEAIWANLGADITLTTSFHHEANGQPERFMLTLTNALRSYCNARGTNWDQTLVACELAYNTAAHSSTGLTPIEVDIGVKARLPIDLTRREATDEITVSSSIDVIHEKEIQAFQSILNSQSRYVRNNNTKRRAERYEVGDMVRIGTSDLAELNAPGAKKLRSRWSEPFAVIEVVGDVNVRLKLPDSWQRIHPIFHVSRLRRAHIRDESRFPNVDILDDDLGDNHDDITALGTSINETDLRDYSERGAAVAQIERDISQSERNDNTNIRSVTRSAAQRIHDRGDRYDYLQL